jgi:hypothetical protein
MADQDDVRRIALSLPSVTEGTDGFRFLVEGKGFAWVWLERAAPTAKRLPNPDVLAVRVADAGDKDALFALDDDVFFTEPHYDGYPAVLVRLAAIDPELLQEVITSAWRAQAPKRLIRAFDAGLPFTDPEPAPG